MTTPTCQACAGTGIAPDVQVLTPAVCDLCGGSGDLWQRSTEWGAILGRWRLEVEWRKYRVEAREGT